MLVFVEIYMRFYLVVVVEMLFMNWGVVILVDINKFVFWDY